jgi:hypothetical protein
MLPQKANVEPAVQMVGQGLSKADECAYQEFVRGAFVGLERRLLSGDPLLLG